MINSYKKQIAFEHWSNQLLLHTLAQAQPLPERALLLFSHLISSHCMWLSRVTKMPITCTLFQERSLEECAAQMTLNEKGWLAFLESIADDELQQTIEFLSAWEEHPSKRIITLEDALIHLINHSSYHRGQIVQLLKGIVTPLPLTTYIMYASEVIE